MVTGSQLQTEPLFRMVSQPESSFRFASRPARKERCRCPPTQPRRSKNLRPRPAGHDPVRGGARRLDRERGAALHRQRLDFSQDDLSWVVNAYTLFFGGFLLLGGRLADLLGRRRIFIVGLVAVRDRARSPAGSRRATCQLIAARALQGLGAAIISPAALAIVTTTFAEGAERNKALGVWGAVAGAGGAAGVLLGGVLTEYLGWEWVLFVNVPIALVAALLAPRLLDESRDDAATTFDIPGAVPVTAGLALLVYALVDAEQAGWGSTPDARAARRWRRAARHSSSRSSCARAPADAVLDLPPAHPAGREHRRAAASACRCSRCSSSSRSTCSRCWATSR